MGDARKYVAEREGFEPSNPLWGLRDFESRAFDHSAISPLCTVSHFTSMKPNQSLHSGAWPSLREQCIKSLYKTEGNCG